MHDDGGGDVGSLDRQIVKVVGRGHAQNSDQKGLREHRPRQAQAGGLREARQDRQQHQKRKCGAALGKNQRIDRAQRLQPGKPSGESGSAQAGRDSPAERGAGDVEIAADRFADFCAQVCLGTAKICRASLGWADADTCPYVAFVYLRLSVLGSGWISTRNSSGNSCLKRISRSVEISCTLESGRSSAMVQWAET